MNVWFSLSFSKKKLIACRSEKIIAVKLFQWVQEHSRNTRVHPHPQALNHDAS